MFKELIDPVLKFLPRYVNQLAALLVGPKRFLAERDLSADEAMTDALLFLGITLIVTFVAQLPLLPDRKDPLAAFATRAVIGFLSLAFFAAVLQLCWRLVGGAASFRSILIVTCYVSGFAILPILVFALAAEGTYRLLDPDGYRQMRSGELDSLAGVGFLPYAALIGLGLAASVAWVTVAWGAYRRINAVSRAKSAVAFVLANTLGLLALAVTIPMAGVLQPLKDRETADALPRELVGRWTAKDDSLHTMDAYNFTSSGNYYYFNKYGSLENNCVSIRSVDESGRAKYDRKEKQLRLNPDTRRQTLDNSCTGKHAEEALPATEEVYDYEMAHRTTGWTLCLHGRMGTKCVSPAEPLP